MKKILTLLIICILFTGCSSNKKEEEAKPVIEPNFNEKVIENKVVGDFTFKNTQLLYNNETGITLLETVIENNTDKDKYVGEFEIIVKDAGGYELVKLIGVVGSNVKAHQTRAITSYTDVDLSLADSVEYIFEE